MWLGRRRGGGDFRPPADPDPSLRNLGVDDAARLRDLVRQAASELGIEVVVLGDHLRAPDGASYGLWDLSVRLAGTASAQWEEVVTRHVRLILAAPASGGLDVPDDLDDAELARRVVLRLHEPRSLAGAGVLCEPGPHPDLVRTLSIDLPEAVSTPTSSFWEGHGGERPWRMLALDNLGERLDGTDLDVRRVAGRGDRGYTVVHGASFLVASFVLVLPRLAARAAQSDRGRGLLVATPNRHQVLLRAVTGTEHERLTTLIVMMREARMRTRADAGPLSPTVFWVHEGRWVPLDGEERLGSDTIAPTDALARALGISTEPW